MVAVLSIFTQTTSERHFPEIKIFAAYLVVVQPISVGMRRLGPRSVLLTAVGKIPWAISAPLPEKEGVNKDSSSQKGHRTARSFWDRARRQIPLVYYRDIV